MSKKRVPSPPTTPQTPAQTPTSPLHLPVGISYRYHDAGGPFCLSHCTPDEVREAQDCLRQLTTLSWQQVLQTGGKGGR